MERSEGKKVKQSLINTKYISSKQFIIHQQSKSEIINKQLLPEELEGTHKLTMDENLHSRF